MATGTRDRPARLRRHHPRGANGRQLLGYHPDLLAAASTRPGASGGRACRRRFGCPRPVGWSAASQPGADPVTSTTLRSESIASSWIEGIRATRERSPRPDRDEAASHSASQIVRNVTAMREAIDLLGSGAWASEHILHIHHDLLPWHPRAYRRDQVWVGGTNKLNADYAAPPADKVGPYVGDLLTYANTSGDLPVVQAAIIHAQFETIHPFNDGNGRVGRTLVHGILKRAGLVDGGVIPLLTGSGTMCPATSAPDELPLRQRDRVPPSTPTSSDS